MNVMYNKLFKYFRKKDFATVGLIGAGEFGTTILSQSLKNPLLKMPIVADIDLESARLAFRRARVDEDRIVECDSRIDALKALENGKFVILEDPMILMELPVDVIVEATGVPEAGAKHAYEAIKRGKHVAMVNKEADSVVGPILKHLADERGITYTPVDGDQHGLLIGLISWAESLGLEVICAGKSRDQELIYDKGQEVIYKDGDSFEKAIKLSSDELRFFDYIPEKKVDEYIGNRKNILRDFSKAGDFDFCELEIVANNSLLNVDTPAFHQPALFVTEIPEVLCPIENGGILKRKGAIEVITCMRGKNEPGLGGGVFIVISCENEYSREIIRSKGVIFNKSKTAGLIYRPYHLCGVEAINSILLAGLLNISTGGEAFFPRYDVIKRVNRDLKSGEILGGDHSSYFDALIVPAIAITDKPPLPGHLITNNRLIKDVPSGSFITSDMIEVPEDSVLWYLRKLQDEHFMVRG